MSTETQPKIEEIPDTAVEETKPEAVEDAEIEAGSEVLVHSRGEKKARKLISKLNLKKVEGINRVVIRQQRAIFAIEKPDVYRNPATGTYVVFGEAKVDTQAVNLAQQLSRLTTNEGGADAATGGAPDLAAGLESAAAEAANPSEPEEQIDDKDVDTTGLDESEIELIMTQANTTKAKAVAALRRNKNDVVNAIMELTG
jgi:nascent polypeptide-associated complex subunit alpha